MKTKLLKSLLTIACLLCSIAVYAHEFEVDGIYYNITAENEVEVTYAGDSYSAVSNEYTGAVAIPETVTYSGITYNVTSIRACAFLRCTGLTSVVIPNSVTSIGNSAFNKCTGLTEVIIPNSVTSIGSNAFSGCTGLTEITIPNSVTSIGESAFYECSGLTTVNFNAENCTTMGSESFLVFVLCNNLTTVNIGESVKKIPDYGFRNCSGLTEITIPCSVTSIGSFAFSGCTGLTLIRIEAVNPPTIQSNTFKEVDKSIPVYVPAESVEAYQKAEYWSEFTNIQEITIPDVIATSLTLDNEVLEMYPGDAVQLTATVLPDNTTNKVVTWTSSDNEVATVDESGNVTAVSIGSATITATTTDGSNLTATCEVTVVQKMVKLTMQNSYYNNVIFFLLPGTEQKIQIVNIDPMFVLNTVMFNDENVTEQLIDRVYVTPALEEDAVINISYDIPTAQNAPMHNNRIKAYGHRGDVVVAGCERGESIAIYDVDGVLLRTMFATSDTMRIAMPTDAVYVVKVADAAVKVAL